jgi:hypothetical protein
MSTSLNMSNLDPRLHPDHPPSAASGSDQPPAVLLIRQPPIAAFPPAVKQASNDLITSTGYKCRTRMSYDQWLMTKNFCDNPDLKAHNAEERHLKHRAATCYELRRENGTYNLYRLPNKGDKVHSSPRYVLAQSEVFDKLTSVYLRLQHPGRDKFFNEVDAMFYGLARKEVYWIKDHCETCLLAARLKNKAPLTPIISDATFERVQLDLIDMRHTPSGQYCWICHIKDHWSKYSQLYPLKSKHVEGVAQCIALWAQAFFPPKILQCDNGKEFKGKKSRFQRYSGYLALLLSVTVPNMTCYRRLFDLPSEVRHKVN